MKKIVFLVGFFVVFASVSMASGAAPENGTSASVGVESAARVEIFVTSWCPYCRQLETFLKKNQIRYTRYDIEKDARGAELFDKIGGAGVPVSRVGKKVIHGYDPDRIIAALESET